MAEISVCLFAQGCVLGEVGNMASSSQWWQFFGDSVGGKLFN